MKLLLAGLFVFSGLIKARAEEPPSPVKPEICYPPTKQNYPSMKDPISDTSGADCASNTLEMREKFPNTVETLYRLEGSWTDANFRKRVTALPKNKQYRDANGNWVVNAIDNTTVTYRFNANKQGIWIQETSEDKKGKQVHSNISLLQICKKNDSIFLKINNVEIPVAFPSKHCMWVGGKGKWWRFWRFQDVHFSFVPPTDNPNQTLPMPEAPLATPVAPVVDAPSPAPDFLPGLNLDLFPANGVR